MVESRRRRNRVRNDGNDKQLGSDWVSRLQVKKMSTIYQSLIVPATFYTWLLPGGVQPKSRPLVLLRCLAALAARPKQVVFSEAAALAPCAAIRCVLLT
jgi:hypothetical protein